MSAVVSLSSDQGIPDIAIDITCNLWVEVDFDLTDKCRASVIEAIACGAQDTGAHEISIVLADDAFVRNLNQTWRGVDAPTNVLAFPCSDGEELTDTDAQRLLGDVVVAYQTTEREASEFGISFEHHFAHLIVHGVLHLLGYDHIEDHEATLMETLEVKALSELGIDDPYREEIGDG